MKLNYVPVIISRRGHGKKIGSRRAFLLFGESGGHSFFGFFSLKNHFIVKKEGGGTDFILGLGGGGTERNFRSRGAIVFFEGWGGVIFFSGILKNSF